MSGSYKYHSSPPDPFGTVAIEFNLPCYLKKSTLSWGSHIQVIRLVTQFIPSTWMRKSDSTTIWLHYMRHSEQDLCSLASIRDDAEICHFKTLNFRVFYYEAIDYWDHWVACLMKYLPNYMCFNSTHLEFFLPNYCANLFDSLYLSSLSHDFRWLYSLFTNRVLALLKPLL